MAAVDTAMVQICGLDLLQVMEVAGRSVAIAARAQFSLDPESAPRAVVLCGSGGNGGDAMVCARYLADWNWRPELWLIKPSSAYSGMAGHQLEICRRLGIQVREPDAPIEGVLADADLVIDGLFGFGLDAPVEGRAAELIDWANHNAFPGLAIDIPSGIHATTGAKLGRAFRASVTVTLGLPKLGLVREEGPAYAGRILVADIGIPAAAYDAVGIPRSPIFWNHEFIELAGRTLLPVSG